MLPREYVGSVLRDPERFASGAPTTVYGILVIKLDTFHLIDVGRFGEYRGYEGETIPIDDPQALQAMLGALPKLPLWGDTWFKALAIVEACTRRRTDGWALHDVREVS